MFRTIHFRAMLRVVFGIAVAISGSTARAQETDNSQDKHLDIQSSVGDLHMGTDADARKAGLPLYPGARLHRDEDNDKGVNFGVVTEAFG